MKKFLSLIILLMAAITIHSQETEELKPLSFSEVVKVDSMSAKQLSEAMRRWVETNYQNPAKVKEIDTNGQEMMISCQFKHDPKTFTTSATRGIVSYNINIQFRDGRMKITMAGFYHQSTNLHPGVFKQDKLSGGHVGTIYNRDVTKEEAKNIEEIGGALNTTKLTRPIYNSAAKKYREKAEEEWNDFISLVKSNIPNIKSQKADEDW